MKNTIRILVLLLALLMLLPTVAACTGDQGNEETTTAKTEDDTQNPNEDTTDQGGADTEDTTTAPEDETDAPTSSLPLMNWDDKEYYVLGRADPNGYGLQFGNLEVFVEEYDPTDIIGSAVFERNEILAEKYGIIVNVNLVESVYNTASTHLEAQEDMYEMHIYIPNTVQTHASMGYLYDMKTTQYIDLNHDCWNPIATDQLTFGNKLFYNTSDFLLQEKNRTYLMIYNRELLRTRVNDYSYLEDQFLATDTWTLGNALEVLRQFTFDMDGKDGLTQDDCFGLTSGGEALFAVFCYGAGVTISTKDENNYPVLTGATEAIIDRINEAGRLYFDPTLHTLQPQDYTPFDYYGPITSLETGNALMMASIVSEFDSGFEPEFEFGYMPYPKFDTNQERYYTTINYENASIMAIPYTAERDFAGFAIQASSEESTDTTLYAFYEARCKLENSYDQRCADVLDIVFESVVYDIAAMNNYGKIYQQLANTLPSLKKPELFATVYPAYSLLAQQEIEKIKAAYEEMD